MGQEFSQPQGGAGGNSGGNKKDDKDKKKKWEPPVPPPRVGKKQKKRHTGTVGGKLPAVTPNAKCKLRLLKLERLKDYLLMEEEFVANQVRISTLHATQCTGQHMCAGHCVAQCERCTVRSCTHCNAFTPQAS